MSAEVGVHWRPLVSCNSPSASATTTSLPPLPDLIPIKKSQKCYDRLFKTENNSLVDTPVSNNGLVVVPANISAKQAGSNDKDSWSTAADCYEFVDELEFDDFNDGITNTTSASSRNTKAKCNSGGKKRQVYNQFLPLYTGSNSSGSVTTNTNEKCSETVVVKQERGESEHDSLSDDVKKEKHRRSRRTHTQQNTFTSADSVHPIDYHDTDVFDDDESKSRDVSSHQGTDNSNNITALYDAGEEDDANVFNDDDDYYTNEMHTKAIRAVNKKNIQQKHRKTGRRKQTKKRKPTRQSNPIKKTQQQKQQFINFQSNNKLNNKNSLSVPRVNPIFLWVKQDDTTIVEVRCEDYDKRNRIRLTKTLNGWKAIPRTEKSFILPPSNLEHLSRSDGGSTSNVVDTEEDTRKKVHKKHKRKKKKHKKERIDSVSTRDTDTTTEPELKVPPIIVNIKQEAVEKRAQKNSKDCRVIKVEALEPREGVMQCQNGTYDETKSFPEEFDNIEAHIPSHTISLAAINKDRYVHAHVSHNNNNNNDFISELGFNHQERQENTLSIEKPIPNDVSSAYHRISCGNNNNGESMSNSGILGASPTPILIPTPPPPPTGSLVSNIVAHQHEQQPPSASLLMHTTTLENARVRNVVAATTQTMPTCMESSMTSVARIEMHSSGGGGENRKVHSQSLLPNNNNSICETRLLDESGAVCTNVQQQQGVLRGTKDASTTSSISNMCPDSAPPTAVYETLKREVAECIENNTEHLLSENNKENVLHFPDNKHLSDYPDCSELINEICDIQSAATHDLMSQHCDNTMTGAELLDSLIEQRCEDNHISGADDDVKNSIYTISDDYNDDDDLLLNQAPVSDILSRLNETLASAPKCLSFNEAGEIEGLHGDLFDTAHNPLNTMEDNMGNPFSQTTGLDDLSLTIKNLTGNSDSEFSDSRKESDSSKDCNNSNQSITILSADSCEEEIPKDLTCKKQENEANAISSQKKSVSHSPRPVSHSSDTIQSPQPSGLPAVPPSPELFPSNNKIQSSNNSTKLFIESILASPKRSSSEAQQKEPLNLGKCRKSASPTVSCSEEINKPNHAMEPVVISDDEPSKKRMKKEAKDKDVIDVDKLPNPETARLLELLTSGNDPDPLTQFRLLISNPAWKVPDPLLVPKDRLNAVLASPAREIPLLLTTRPELRLPEAFAFPAILQDPDILVISLAQLERILHNQEELLKAKAKAGDKEGELHKKSLETSKNSPVPKSDTHVESSENTNDVNAAMNIFNQMLWLPYLQQMGQFNPEMFKTMMGLQAPTMPDMLSFMSQNRFNDFSMPNPMDYKRQIEAAMWQEAMTNNANLQRAMKIKADSQKKANEAKASAASKSQETARSMAAAQAQSKLNQMMNPLNPLTGMSSFMQPALANQRFFQQQQQQAAQLRTQLTSQQTASQLQAAYNASAYNKQAVNNHHNRSQQSPTQKKSSNNLLNQNPFLQVPNNFQEFHEQQQQLARRLQKEKDQQLKQQHQQMQQEQKPRVTCKSLSNLMQPPRNAQADLAMYGHTNMSKMSNLMAMPGLNMHPGSGSSSSSQSSNASHSHGSPQQMHNHHHHQQQQHQQQQAKLKVKPGLSLLDPAALQRRLLSNEDDITGGTVNLEESPDMTSPLWHPLFGK